MRTVLVLWLSPTIVFWSWHLLAASELAFGRHFHDHVMQLYAGMLGVAPETIPALFAKAFVTDGLLLLAILGFRKRHAIGEALRRAWARHRE